MTPKKRIVFIYRITKYTNPTFSINADAIGSSKQKTIPNVRQMSASMLQLNRRNRLVFTMMSRYQQKVMVARIR